MSQGNRPYNVQSQEQCQSKVSIHFWKCIPTSTTFNLIKRIHFHLWLIMIQVFIVHCFICKSSTFLFLFLLPFTWWSFPIHHHPENAFFPDYLLQLGFYKLQTPFIKDTKLLKCFPFHLNMVQRSISCQLFHVISLQKRNYYKLIERLT